MSNFIRPLGPITTGRPSQAQAVKNRVSERQTSASFQELLSRTMAQTAAGEPQRLTFSRHAQERTEQRGIALSETDFERLDAAVEKAGDKGLGDTLVFMNSTAFIVNVPNRVVITVLEAEEAQNTVFTNIDGAVIV